MFKETWNGLVEQFGQTVTLYRGEEEKTVRAFFQPVREKTAEETPTALGTAPLGKWLYLGRAEEPLEDVTALVWQGRRFDLIRRREYAIGQETVYRWAVAEESDEEREA